MQSKFMIVSFWYEKKKEMRWERAMRVENLLVLCVCRKIHKLKQKAPSTNKPVGVIFEERCH